MRGRILSPTAARVVGVKIEPYNFSYVGKAGKPKKYILMMQKNISIWVGLQSSEYPW